jgi:K+-sensing histidine kinase KdpD
MMQRQEILAEVRFKSLLLSKISHEIKNPLICISELINQSSENLSKISFDEPEVKKKLKMANYLSNFLQILVNDYEYFSATQRGKKPTLNLKEVDLLDTINFSENIIRTLIHKDNKSEKVDFIKFIDPFVPPKISTDEGRLRQLIVNILYYSAKNTPCGKIGLEVTVEKIENKNFLQFCIYHTRFSSKCEKISALLTTNFYKCFNYKNYDLDSGFGLFLSKEIAEILGAGLKFESTEGEGTKFWFHIPLSYTDFPHPQRIDDINNKNPYIITINSEEDYVNYQIQVCDSLNSFKTDESNSIETKKVFTLPYPKPSCSNILLNDQENSIMSEKNESKSINRSELRSLDDKLEDNFKNSQVIFVIFIF